MIDEKASVINKEHFFNFIYGVVLDSLTDRVELIKLLNNNVKAYYDIYKDIDLGRNKSKNLSKQRKYEYESIDVFMTTCLYGINIIMCLEDEHNHLAVTYKDMHKDYINIAYDLYEQLNYKSNRILLEKSILKETLKNAPTQTKKERKSL